VQCQLETDRQTAVLDAAVRQVAFQGRAVEVRADDPSVLARVQHHFQHLLSPDSTDVVAALEVRRKGTGYRLLGSVAAEATEGSLSQVLSSLFYEIVVRLIDSQPNLLWLHAGAAAYGDRAVLVSGASGCGKSTLVTSLCQRGWSFLSDDVIPLDLATFTVLPFPQMPMVRRNCGRELPAGRLAELPKTKPDLPADNVSGAAASVAVLILPRYTRSRPRRLSPCSPAQAGMELLRNCLNFKAHRQTAVERLCALVKQVPTFSLTFGQGADAAEQVARAHEKGYRI
jgi:hypothetical protein